MVGGGAQGAGRVGRTHESVVHLRATPAHAVEAHAVVEALGGIYAQHGIGEPRLQFVEHGLAHSGTQTANHAGDDAAHGVALALHLLDEGYHAPGRVGIGAAHGVAVDGGEVELGIRLVEAYVAHLRGVGAHRDATGSEHLHGYCPGGHAHGRLSRARSTSATMVAHAVLHKICIVGM